jgi:predicted dehydrogenase
MRVLIVSFGSIARRHLANLRTLEPAAQVTILRRAVDPDLPEVQVTTLEAALARRPDAALICSPASDHIRVARQLAEAGVALFIEKPLSHSLDGVSDLVTFAREQKLPLMVGYCLRYFEPLRLAREALLAGRIGQLRHLSAEVGQYLPDWRPETDYRTGVTAQKALGGGALLELSHELDYVRWLAGEVDTLDAELTQLSSLEIDVEDSADLTLRFASGARGTIHLDLLARPAYRRCRMIGSEGTLEVDFIAGTARVFEHESWHELAPLHIDRNAMYLAELSHFLHCVQSGAEPEISGRDGARVIELIAQARTSAACLPI